MMSPNSFRLILVVTIVSLVTALLPACVEVKGESNYSYPATTLEDAESENREQTGDRDKPAQTSKREKQAEEKNPPEWLRKAATRVEQWVRALRSGDRKKKKEIGQKIRSVTRDHRQQILQFMQRGTPRRKVLAVQMAPFLDGEEVDRIVRRNCRDGDAAVQKNAYVSLGILGPETADRRRIERGMESDNPRVRTGASFALMRFVQAHGDVFSPDDLWPYLMDSHPWVRNEVTLALGYLGGDKSVELLSDRLRVETSGRVRASTIFSLYRIGSEKALKKLANFVNDSNKKVRQLARRALVKKTNHDFGGNSEKWRKYIEQNKLDKSENSGEEDQSRKKNDTSKGHGTSEG